MGNPVREEGEKVIGVVPKRKEKGKKREKWTTR